MVRAVCPDELPSIAALYHHLWHEAEARFVPEEERCRRTLLYFVERLRPLTTSLRVSDGTDGLAGFVCWRGDYLGQIYVRLPYRGSGVATDLLAAAEQAMTTAGIVETALHCHVENHRAHRFYTRHGWRDDGVLPRQFAGSGGDVDIPMRRMCKRLG